ncbi:hypothetical protein [Edaphobacter aggregans]|uniref:hypothetical protein n=1 Tax=Edaphobacter aggregans TaxID=570835 RepID=UPI000555D195|nr:hypothetical protein [Edaphobacter aggregans]
MHDGPVEGLLVGGARVSGEDVVVGLGPGEADDAAEGSHELELELELLLGCGAGAAAVEDEDGVEDVAGGGEGVEALGNGVLTAAGGLAGTGSEHEVGDGAVGVVDDGDLDVEVVGALNVGGEDDAGGGGVGVGRADVLGECAAMDEGDARGGDGPDVGGGVDDGVGGMVDVYQMTELPSVVKKGLPVTQRGPLACAAMDRARARRR